MHIAVPFARIKVYNMEELRLNLVPDIESLQVRAKRDILSKALEGDFTTLFKGKGMEFAGFREYSYDDDASMIDWAASLRAKKTLVREFEVQKNFNIFMLLDVSDKMLFSSTKKNKLKVEHAAELLNRLAYAMLQSNNAVGMAMFSDDFKVSIRPDIGMGIMAKINRYLRDKGRYGGGFDFKRALLLTNTYLKQRTLVIIISDFLDLQDGWSKYLNGLRPQHEVIGIIIRDPRDEQLPDMAGQFVLEDPYGKDKSLIDLKQYKKKYAAEVKAQDERLRNSFGMSNYSLVKLRTDQDMVNPLMSFFRKRAMMYKLM